MTTATHLTLTPEQKAQLKGKTAKQADEMTMKWFPGATEEAREALLAAMPFKADVPGQAESNEGKAEAPKKAPAKAVAKKGDAAHAIVKVKCIGKTKAGGHCTMPVIKGLNVCFAHMSQAERDARGFKMATPKAGPKPVKLAGALEGETADLTFVEKGKVITRTFKHVIAEDGTHALEMVK